MEIKWEKVISTKSPVFIWDDDETEKVVTTLTGYFPYSSDPFVSYEGWSGKNCRVLTSDDLYEN